MARCKKRKDQLKESIEYFEKAVELDSSNNVDLRVETAETLVLNQQLKAAVDYYNMALKLDSDTLKNRHVEIFKKLGDKCKKDKDFKVGMEYYNMALKLDPDNIDVLVEAAETLRLDNQLESAIYYFKYILELHPNYSYALIGLAEALTQKGLLAEAKEVNSRIPSLRMSGDLGKKGTAAPNSSAANLEELKLVLKSQPNNVDLWIKTAEALVLNQQLEEAITHFNQALDLDKANYNARYGALTTIKQLVDKYRKGKAFNLGIHYQKIALKLAPQNATTLTEFAELLRLDNQFEESIVHFRQALGLDNKCILAMIGLAEALRQNNQLEEAITYYDKAIALYSQWNTNIVEKGMAMAYAGRGEAYSSLKDFKNAENDFKKALALCPGYSSVVNFKLGVMLKNKGELDNALHCFLKAIKVDKNNCNAFKNLGEIYVLRQEYDQAIESYSEALKIDPYQASTCLTLSNLYYNTANKPLKGLEYALESYKIKYITNNKTGPSSPSVTISTSDASTSELSNIITMASQSGVPSNEIQKQILLVTLPNIATMLDERETEKPTTKALIVNSNSIVTQNANNTTQAQPKSPER